MHFAARDIRKSFDGYTALDGVSFDVGEQDFVCLLGPSGCGKTTLLRVVAGLLRADSGTLLLDGNDFSDVPARARGFGIVFQSYSLFPHMTVLENIAYGMKLRGKSPHEIAARGEELLRLIQMPTSGKKYPSDLSGGQQQRVALARALAIDPSLLLLDEPLSALDARVREQIRGEIHQLQRQLAIPTLMVTHDQDEALSLADTIICMNAGKIEQIGSPRDLYSRPATRFVAQFIGTSNLLSTAWIRDAVPSLMCHRPFGNDEAYVACVRPEDIRIETDEHGAGTVQSVDFHGSFVRLTVNFLGCKLTVEQHRDCSLDVGHKLALNIEPEHCVWVAA